MIDTGIFNVKTVKWLVMAENRDLQSTTWVENSRNLFLSAGKFARSKGHDTL